MRLNYRDNGTLRSAHLSEAERADVTDCLRGGGHSFVAIDFIGPGEPSARTQVGAYLTPEAARKLRDTLNGLELGDE